jgi:hypothetical protein
MKTQLTECNDVSCMSELIPPAFLRKQEGGISSPAPLQYSYFR